MMIAHETYGLALSCSFPLPICFPHFRGALFSDSIYPSSSLDGFANLDLHYGAIFDDTRG